MSSYKDLAEYIKSITPDLQDQDDRLVAEYAVESFPDQFNREEFEWEIAGEVRHPPQVMLPKDIAKPSVTLPGAETETIEPLQVTPPTPEEEQEALRGLAKARDPLATAGRVGVTAAGAVTRGAGKLYQRQPEVDPEYEQRATRGEQIATEKQLTPDQFSYQGDVPIIPKNISKTMTPLESQDLWTYLNKQRRAGLSQMGKRMERTGQELIETGEEIQPRQYREEELSRAITDIEQAHPGIATSFKEGDVSGALDGLLFDASISGDEEAIKTLWRSRSVMAQQLEG